MILCAGLGTRLRPFTEKTPKPLIPFFGVPTVQYSVEQLKNYGVTNIVYNVHAHADLMESKMKEICDHQGIWEPLTLNRLLILF
jgi:NDP-sugar pyrophosphorylase family protein